MECARCDIYDIRDTFFFCVCGGLNFNPKPEDVFAESSCMNASSPLCLCVLLVCVLGYSRSCIVQLPSAGLSSPIGLVYVEELSSK